MKKVFSVFPQNLAYYNEGELVGDWIELPQSPEVINTFLKDVVKVDDEHEEYEIADIDSVPFPYESIQWASLEKLNNLAIVYNTLTVEQKDAIQAHLESIGEEHYDIDELINICLQADKINYFEYYFEGIEYNQDFSCELKLGYTLAEENGLYDSLKKQNILDFFDFEKYGESFSYDYELYSKGYLIPNYDMDINFYSEDEIEEKIQVILNKELQEDMQIEI